MSGLGKDSITKGLRLYRQILKMHYKKLPAEMRIIGFAFVRNEFRENLQKASEEQFQLFSLGWEKYLKDWNKNMNQIKSKQSKKKEYEEDIEKLSDDQKKTLDEFKHFIKSQ